MRLSFSVHHRVQFLLLLNKASGNELKISERPVLTTVLIESNHETYQPSRQRVDINLITTPELEPALFNNNRNCTSWCTMAYNSYLHHTPSVLKNKTVKWFSLRIKGCTRRTEYLRLPVSSSN